MATTISRTWYDTLQDDSGAGTDGSIWDKADVDSLLDAIDALLAANLALGGTLSITGALTGVTSLTMSAALTGATRVSVTGGTIASDAPVFNATQTWNAAGIEFAAAKINITNTASATGSTLLDLQVGGVSQFKVRKDGMVTGAKFLSGASGWNVLIAGDGIDGAYFGTNTDFSNLSTINQVAMRMLGDGTYPFQIQTSPATAVAGARTWTTRLRLTTAGYFGLGAVPTVPLQVNTGDTGAMVVFRHTHASTPSGVYINFSAATPNNSSQYFFYCDDSTAVRAAMYSNGGLHNYSGNNVNLSDLGAKDITGPAPKNMRGKIRQLKFYRGRYKDSTRGHDDLMWGAQDILAIDPEWVDVWQQEARDEAGTIVKPRLLGTRDHLIFMASVQAVAEHDALLEALDARLQKLEK